MENILANTQIFRYSLICFISFIAVFGATGQRTLSTQNNKAASLYNKADKKYKERDFEAAIVLLNKAISQDTTFFEAYHRVATLFNAMGDADTTYFYLKKYIRHCNFPSQNILRRATLMAFDRGHYDKASAYLGKVKKQVLPDRQIERVRTSLDYIKKEENRGSFEIKELPIQINKYPLQYLPAITVDNAELIYTKRDSYSGDEDIVVSRKRNGQWTEATSISDKINTPLNEGASTISADGNTMVLTSCDRRDALGSCDLYISKKSVNGWSRPKNMGKQVNTKYWESQPSLSADGKKLYFASNRPGGRGGRDIWLSENIDQRWSKPVNAGQEINSWGDDTTPFIHPNGETLYFSSNGRPGFGGFDLYQSTYLDTLWSLPSNLGGAINSHKDEVGLLIAADGKTAYFSQEKKKNGRIYESIIVNFKLPEEVRSNPVSYIVGRVFDHQSRKPLRAKIEIVDVRSSRKLFRYTSDSLTGEYLMVLPQSKELAGYVKKRGYLYSSYHFLSEKNDLVKPDTIDIYLHPIIEGEKLILRNIYFDHDSYEIDERSNSELESVTDLMEENTSISIEISGHTDNTGTKSYNRTLSENRAKAVLDELVRRGIDASKLSFKGYGDTEPIASNETNDGRESNRRIEFRVIEIN